MPTRRLERIPLAQLLVSGCAVVFGLIELAQAQPGYVPPPTPPATARFKSVQSLYGASTALPADHAYNTKHNTFTTKHRSKW